jgi:hypothetical protein
MSQQSIKPENIDLSHPVPARRDALCKRFMKCGKPGCGCAESADKRHGPYFSLVRVVKGKTSSRYISAEQAAVAQQQIERGKLMRQAISQRWEECEAMANAELDAVKNAKNPEKKGSRRKSPQKSKKK